MAATLFSKTLTLQQPTQPPIPLRHVFSPAPLAASVSSSLPVTTTTYDCDSLLLGNPTSYSLQFLALLARIESPVGSADAPNLLDTAKVLDLNGNEIPISDLWKDRRAVVAFARHFGCVFCRKRADYLASKKDIFDASGVALVLIGPGNIDQAKAFSEQTKFKGGVFMKELELLSIDFDFSYAASDIIEAGLKIIQLYMEGYRQDWKLSFQKDTVSRSGWQQGGIIVAGPGKTNISYIHKDKEAGDDPEIEDILIACCS